MKLSNPQGSLSHSYGADYFKSRGFHDHSIREYSRKEKLFNLEWASAVTKQALLKGYGKTALDAGCGVGLNAFILNDLGYTVTGLDFSPYAIQEAGRHSRQEKRENLKWMVSDLDSESIPDFYDLIICWEVIEHVQNPEVVLQKLFSALKPKGTLVVTTPNRLGLSHLLLAKDPTHFHVHSSFWWAQRLKRLKGSRWVCRSMMFWDHVFPWLRDRERVMAHSLPILGFRIRMAITKIS